MPLSGIWQCDSHGRYHYVDDRAAPPLDPDFQGYGTTVSAADGGYCFRTIRPVPYPGRTPHIHFAITTPRGSKLVTQMYVAGESLNERDPILADIRDLGVRDRVVVPLNPAPQLKILGNLAIRGMRFADFGHNASRANRAAA